MFWLPGLKSGLLFWAVPAGFAGLTAVWPEGFLSVVAEGFDIDPPEGFAAVPPDGLSGLVTVVLGFLFETDPDEGLAAEFPDEGFTVVEGLAAGCLFCELTVDLEDETDERDDELEDLDTVLEDLDDVFEDELLDTLERESLLLACADASV